MQLFTRIFSALLQLVLIAAAAPNSPPAPAAASVTTTEQPFSTAQTLHTQALVDVTVTRGTNGKPINAALVPALQKGDVITIRLSGFEKPGAQHRFHANYVVLSGQSINWWDPSGDGLRLFNDANGPPADKVCDRTPNPKQTHGGCNTFQITYDGIGTPIVVIMVEDGRTKGMVGVRDDVDANPQGYLNNATIAADATIQQTWMETFVSSLASGAVGVGDAGQKNIVNAVMQLGVSKDNANKCYSDNPIASGSSGSDVNKIRTVIGQCLIGDINTANAKSFDAKTLGAFAGSTIALHLSPYVAGLTLLYQFVLGSRKKANYQYLPGSLLYVNPDPDNGIQGGQYLDLPTSPKYEPPKDEVSDVLFFPVGALQVNPIKDMPKVVADTKYLCASDTTVQVPLHLDQSSPYVHDAQLLIRDPTNPENSISEPLADAATNSKPFQTSDLRKPSLKSASVLEAGLSADYGYTPMVGPSVSVVLPSTGASWTASGHNGAPLQEHQKTSVVLTSPEAPCAKELVIPTSAGPVSYPLTVNDANHATADNVQLPTGSFNATVVLQGQSALQGTVAITANSPLPVIESTRVFVDDKAIFVKGKRINTITGIQETASHQTFTLDPSYKSGTADCFTTTTSPPLTAGTPATMQIQTAGANFNLSFDVLDQRPPAPTVSVDRAIPDGLVQLADGTYGSNDFVHVNVQGVDFLNSHRTLRVRVKPGPKTIASSPCGGIAPVDAKDFAEVAPTRLDVSGADFFFRPGDTLRERAVGTLQVAVFDQDLNATSDWTDLPGTFVVVPAIDHIACTNVACFVYGHNLGFANGVGDGTSGVIPLVNPCDAKNLHTDHSLECAVVPRLSKFLLYVGKNGAAPVQVPSKMISKAGP